MNTFIFRNLFAAINPQTRLLKKLSESNSKEILSILSNLNDKEKEFLYNELFLEIKPTESISIAVGQVGEETIHITINTSRLIIIYDWFNKSKNTQNLQDILKTERARKYFAKAEEMGYLERTNTGYKSKFETKALLAYFLELVFCRNDNNKDNGMNFPETALNELFQEKRLGKARSQLYNNGSSKYNDSKSIGKPRNYEIVDKMFD